MKKLSKIIIGIILFIMLLMLSFIIFKYKAGEHEKYKICCNHKCFDIEVANTPETRQLGLMYRESLGLDEGMLFVFNEPGLHSFRMKSTLIPLAGIRIDENMKIVDIIEMNPCETKECPSYKPKSEAQYVLEINQGLISEKGLLNIGDSCELQ